MAHNDIHGAPTAAVPMAAGAVLPVRVAHNDIHGAPTAAVPMAAVDSDRFALAITQQYLCEQGYTQALAALERETGLRLKDEVQQGSQLLQLVYDHVERQLAERARQDPASVRRRRLEEELLAGGATPACHPCPLRLQRCIEHVHPSNITSLQCWPARRAAFVGSSDGGVALVSYAGAPLWRAPAGRSGVLCLGLHPNPASALVAAGCMDGSVALLDAGSGQVVARAQPHRKYVVAAAWAPDGSHLVTASWDHSFAVHALEHQDVQAGSAGGGWQLRTVHTEQTASRANAALFLPSGGGVEGEGGNGGQGAGDGCRGPGGDSTFLLAVQGSNYLRRMRIAGGGGAAAKLLPCKPINLNAAGDEHVSFSAEHLALSPCGRMLVVSADSGRMLVYERGGWALLRVLVGLPIEQFHVAAAAFDRTGLHVMAAAHGALCIFHVGTAKRIALLPAHSKTLRTLCYDVQANLLLTGGYDRAVRVWEAEERNRP